MGGGDQRQDEYEHGGPRRSSPILINTVPFAYHIRRHYLPRLRDFGWIVPAAVGFRLLEDPETVPKRIRTRSKDIAHVYAEPVLGIAELVSVRNTRLTSLTMSDLNALFWSWDARGDLVLGHPAYHPQTNITAQSKEVITHG